MTDTPVFIRLPNRGLISLSGHDCFDFLQGLITNDLQLLEQQESVYACLLTPNGKFLFDFFIVKDGEQLLLDCEGGEQAQKLLQRLRMFKLRADVNFEIEEKTEVFSVLTNQQKASFWPDPRHVDIGYRTFEKPSDIVEAPFDVWDEKRIKLAIPDGSRDMIPEKSTLLECNIDKVNGVSFDKGCYMGQELTARMHYRGLTKKEFVPLEFNDKPPALFTDLKDRDGKVVGEMRSSCGNIGLALIKKSALPLSSDEYKLYS